LGHIDLAGRYKGIGWGVIPTKTGGKGDPAEIFVRGGQKNRRAPREKKKKAARTTGGRQRRGGHKKGCGAIQEGKLSHKGGVVEPALVYHAEGGK